ncbi:MAG: hypothetical protein H6579_05390 [Chitinophagales bacterium]|nr:hypothetical protein [Chitinophagales bacterium]
MKNYSSRLIAIKAKVNSLLGEIASLKNEIITLNNSNLALEKDLAKQDEELKDLNEKLKLLKLAKSISGEESPKDKTELKRKINEYIKEIDRCIALIND